MKAKTKSHNKSCTILIVEDSPTQALQARRMLEEGGFRVAVSRNGKEALSYLKEQRPIIIISDIVMPEMDGYELCSTIKNDETLKDIPVILLTALTSPEDVIKGLQSGADNFITKPYEKEFLLSRIQYILINQEARKKGTTEIGLNIYFMGQMHTITSDRMQIIDLLLSTYEHAVLQNQELKRTQTELETLNKQLEEEVKRRTRRMERLNSVLQAVRGVNQLIVREKNRDRLMQRACETLIAARDYHNAWIALIDESGELVTTAEAGLGKEFLPLLRRLKRGELVNCAQRSLKKSGVISTKNPSATCADCPLAKESHAKGAMAVRLEHGGKVYGLLSISIPKDLVRDKEELSLFEEVAGDIGLALHGMKVEEERKRVEQTLHAIFKSASDGILMADAESGRFVVGNDAICQMLGYSGEEIKGLSVADIHPTESLEYVRVQFDKQVRGATTLAPDIPVKRKDGSVFLTDVSSAPLELEGRWHLVGIFRDITERKQREEALRERTYELGERVKELTCLYNISELIEKRDISVEEILQGVVNLIPPAFQYPEITCARIILEGKEFRTENFGEATWKLTQDIMSHDERIGTLGVSYLEQRPERDEGPFIKEGRNLLTLVAARLGHVIERRRAEEGLRLFRILIDQSSDAIEVIDPKTLHFLDANEKALQDLGYSREEFLSLTLNNIDPNLEQQSWNSFGEKILKTGFALFESRHRRKDGSTFPVEVNAKHVRLDRVYLVNIIRDITERKRAEEEQERLRSQLEQAQRMEAIGTLAGGIAHDFNNILSAIIGYTELAREDMPERSKAHANLQEVYKAGIRAKELVQQILAFGRQGEQERKPLHISLLIKEVLKLVRASLPTTIEIRESINSPLDTVFADPTHIHQVLMNLCTNAAHAMREKGGVLEVSLGDEGISGHGSARDPDLRPGPYLKLSVSDTGQGMTPAVMERIFDPYFTTKERGEGTGLGLAVVHGIVKSYDGAITVESQPGEGARFHVFLPRIGTQSEDEIKQEKPPQQGREHILFVDDERPLVDIGKQALERLGYKVTSRTSSIEALEAFRTQPERFDLVITDQTMPNMTGEMLAREMAKIRPDIPVILCTGYSEMVSKQRVEALGIRQLVMKPIVMRDMAEAIRQILDG